MRGWSGTLVAICCIVVGVAACGEGTVPSPPPVSSATPVSAATPSPAIGIRALFPDAQPRFVSVDEPDGRNFSVSAVGADPRSVLGANAAFGPSHFLQDQRLVIRDVASGAEKTLYTAAADPAHTWFGETDTDGQTSVWVQAIDPQYADWRIRAVDDATGKVSDVARAGRIPDGRPIPSGAISPRVDHGVVVWAAATGQTPLGTHYEVYAASVDGTGTRRLAADAAQPEIDWPYVAYSQHVGADAPGGQRLLTVVDLRGGAARTVDGVVDASYFAISGRRLAWVDPEKKRLHLRDLDSGRDVVLADVSTDLTNYVQYPRLNDRFVVWSAAGGEWLYDSRSGRSAQLNQHPLFRQLYLRGSTLAWSRPIPAGSPDLKPWRSFSGYEVLDTGTLR